MYDAHDTKGAPPRANVHALRRSGLSRSPVWSEVPEGAVTSKGHIVSFNGALLRALGFKETDDLTGLGLSALFAHAARADLRAALRTARDVGTSHLPLALSYLPAEQTLGWHMIFEATSPETLRISLSSPAGPAA